MPTIPLGIHVLLKLSRGTLAMPMEPVELLPRLRWLMRSSLMLCWLMISLWILVWILVDVFVDDVDTALDVVLVDVVDRVLVLVDTVLDFLVDTLVVDRVLVLVDTVLDVVLVDTLVVDRVLVLVDTVLDVVLVDTLVVDRVLVLVDTVLDVVLVDTLVVDRVLVLVDTVLDVVLVDTVVESCAGAGWQLPDVVLVDAVGRWFCSARDAGGCSFRCPAGQLGLALAKWKVFIQRSFHWFRTCFHLLSSMEMSMNPIFACGAHAFYCGHNVWSHLPFVLVE